MTSHEHNEQVSLFKWWDVAHKSFNVHVMCMYAIPNAAKRNPRLGKWMKDEGLRSGVWDINLDVPRGIYHGMRIEMKHGKNSLTDAQEIYGVVADSNGYCCKICYSWLEAKSEIEKYLRS